MDVYVLKGGRRTGPFLPFKLREMLEDGEITPADLGWIEGMDAWAPMEKMEALSDWMPRKAGDPPPLPSAGDWDTHLETYGSPAVPALPDTGSGFPRATAAPASADTARGRERAAGDAEAALAKSRPLHAAQRWIARFTDATLWYALVWVVAVEAGAMGLWDWIPENAGPLVMLGVPLLWLPVEATLLCLFGTTPGKWCFGIRISDDLGQKLSWIAGLKRAAMVHVAGNGLGLPWDPKYFLPIVQWSISWMFYRHSGTTLWDRLSRSEVRHAGVPPLGIIAVIMILVGWMAVFMTLVYTAPIPEDFSEEKRSMIEEQRQQFEESRKEWERLRNAAIPAAQSPSPSPEPTAVDPGKPASPPEPAAPGTAVPESVPTPSGKP